MRLPDLDPQLGPIAARHRTSTPRRTVLALLCAAAASTPPIPAATVRNWVTSRLATTRPDVATLADSTTWPTLVTLARDRVAETSSDAGRHRLALSVARRLVGHLLAPTPDGAAAGARAVGTRVALAVVGVRALANLTPGAAGPAAGIDAPRLSADDLGVTAGVLRQTAGGWLKLAETDLGLVRVGSGRGASPTWRIAQLRGAGVAAADEHRAVTATLAAGSADDPVAVTIRSVLHPAWGHTRLGHAAWLTLVADLAGVDPTSLGMARSAPARARTALRAARSDVDAVRSDPAGLLVRLDDLARIGGPDGTALDRVAAAGAAHAVRKADRLASVVHARVVSDSIRAARTSLRTMWTRHESARATVHLPERYDPVRHTARFVAKLAAAGLVLDAVDEAAGTATVRLGAELVEKERAAAEARRAGRERARSARKGQGSARRRTPVRIATTERATVPLPRGFDPARHMDRLAAAVVAQMGPGWTVERVDTDRGVAVVCRTAAA